MTTEWAYDMGKTKGVKEERERILKLIDKTKEQNLCTDLQMFKGYNLACDFMKEKLKEELEK